MHLLFLLTLMCIAPNTFCGRQQLIQTFIQGHNNPKPMEIDEVVTLYNGKMVFKTTIAFLWPKLKRLMEPAHAEFQVHKTLYSLCNGTYQKTELGEKHKEVLQALNIPTEPEELCPHTKAFILATRPTAHLFVNPCNSHQKWLWPKCQQARSNP